MKTTIPIQVYKPDNRLIIEMLHIFLCFINKKPSQILTI